MKKVKPIKLSSIKMNVSDELKGMYLNDNLEYLHSLRGVRFITIIGLVVGIILSVVILLLAPSLGVSQGSARFAFFLMILLVLILSYFFLNIIGSHNPYNERLIRLDVDPRITLTREMVMKNLKELARRVMVAENAFLGVKSYKHHTKADLKRFDCDLVLAGQELDRYIDAMKKFGLPANKQSIFDSLAA